jgi:hypothetical protein
MTDSEHHPPTPDAKFAGTVSLQAVISDKGYTCSVQLIRGFDKAVDEQEMRAAQRWHLPPLRQAGRPVPMIVGLEEDFWRNAGGELVRGSDHFNTFGPATFR